MRSNVIKADSVHQCVAMPRQKGSALIVSLVMLLLITLVAVGGMQSTIMQERMSANLHDRDLAFQAAESALRIGEAFAISDDWSVLSNDSGLYEINNAGRPTWGGGTSTANSAAFAISGSGGTALPTTPTNYQHTLPEVAQQPQFYIEEIVSLQPAGTETETGVVLPPISFYRVTARGFGGSPDTVAIVSSVVRKN